MKIVGALIVACAVGCSAPPTKSFITNTSPSPLNGLWLADGGLRPIGIVIFDVDAGVAWSPHGLLFANSAIYATHSCDDFQIDRVTGSVSSASGAKPLGVLEPGFDGGVLEARLHWQVSQSGQWLELLKRNYRNSAGVRTGLAGVAFEGSLRQVDSDTLGLSYSMMHEVWIEDGGKGFESVAVTETLSRARQCR